MPKDTPPEDTRSTTIDPRSTGTGPVYDDWPISGDEEHADASYIGTTTGGVPVFHSGDTVFEGQPDEENREIRPKPDTERELEPGETLGEVLEDLGDTLGWESLSEYGEKHQSDDE